MSYFLNIQNAKQKYFLKSTVIGKAQPPSIDDRKHMPYTKAFLMEVHRYISLVPNGMSHVCMRDVFFRDITIKKAQS